MSKTHEIVILGANFAGTGVAHYLLRHTIPALTALDGSKTYHITLVGPSNEAFFKISMPRAIVDPSKVSVDQIVLPLSEGFAQYPAANYAFVQGLATGLDAEAKTVTVEAPDHTSRTLPYNTLVIATGTTSDPLWTVNDDMTATRASARAMQESIPSAKNIVIAGGGPVGVETAGEIMAKFPKAKVTLLSGAARLLPNLSEKSSRKASNMLTSKGVSVVHNKKVVSPSGSSASHVAVELDDGSKIDADVYIHSIGGRPNSAFLPAAWLDQRGKVKVDHDSSRVDSRGVYAVGDVAANNNSSVVDLTFQLPAMVTAIGRDIAAAAGISNPKGAVFKEKKFKPMKDTQFVPVGPSGGVGQIMGWGLPSFVVWLVKSRTFFVEKARPLVLGSDYAKP